MTPSIAVVNDSRIEKLTRPGTAASTLDLTIDVTSAQWFHEAMLLEKDLQRAEIQPYAWVVNQSLTALAVTDPVLRSRQSHETPLLLELAAHAPRLVLLDWSECTLRA